MMIDSIKNLLDSITEKPKKTFQENFKCLILYGSWAKGIAREDSDIVSHFAREFPKDSDTISGYLARKSLYLRF